MNSIAVPTNPFAKFMSTLTSSGLRSALAVLLFQTEYRFIAIFRFNGDKATSCVFYDRGNPEVLETSEVSATATYCCFTRDSKGVFVTADSLKDSRLVNHAAREQVRTYCGTPILTPEGDILGTLCHFDLVPRDPSQIDVALMCEVASALAYGNHVPPYPTQKVELGD